jgi:dipeptidase E
LDLREYFGQQDLLRSKLSTLDGLWVSGGNTIVLRQAMRLSCFDTIFKELRWRKEFVYGGYSAGICVLCDSLKYIQHVDDLTDFPYKEWRKIIWDGLAIFHYGLLPHYLSPHPESALITREVEFCIANKWLFKALKDGEVITFDAAEIEEDTFP